MICSKCKSENQRSRFCGYCGYQLKKPCGECGGWEPIGRLICLKKVKEAKTKLEKCVSDARFMDNLLLVIIISAILLVLVSMFSRSIGQQFMLIYMLYFFLVLISAPILIRLEKKRIAKAKEKFFTENPNYKEILEKAGELEKLHKK